MTEDTMVGFRLSPQQRRLWLLQDGAPWMLAEIRITIEGELDPERLETALAAVVGRHEILRTSFRAQPGFKLPFQVIAPQGRVRRLKPTDEPTAASPASADFWRDGALAARLEPAADGHELRLMLPALAADLVSLDHVFADLVAAYDGSELDDEVVQYADFSEWQHELLGEDDEAAERARAFWRERDLTAGSGQALPFEEPRGLGAWGEVTRPVDRELQDAVTALSSWLAAPPSTIWLGVWAMLLARRTGSAPVVAVAHPGRGLDDLADAVGLFARWLPIPALAGGRADEMINHLAKTLDEASEAQQYLDLESDGDQTLAASPLTPFGFVHHVLPEGQSAQGVVFRPRRSMAMSERFKLLLLARDREDGLELVLRFADGRFARADVETLADELLLLARAVVATPRRAVGALPMIGDAERRRLTVDFNRTGSELDGRPVHELFAEWASREPSRVAVVFEDQELSYGRLDALADALAAELRRRGVGPDRVVALCLERSLEMLVAILGVMKAGGAYAVVELAQPERRRAMMLEDLGSGLILSRDELALSLPEGADVLCVDLEALESAAAPEPGKLLPAGEVLTPPTPLSLAGEGGGRRSGSPSPAMERGSGGEERSVPENLAYVVFTSGTTGRPKGVAVEHRQLSNYVQGAILRLGFEPGMSYALVSTFGADLGNTSLYPALCHGGTLHVLSQDRAADAEAFAEYVSRHAVDCLKIVPSHLEALREAEPRRVLPQKRLILGGEASRTATVEALLADAPCRVFNHYGPSETTVGVLTHEVTAASLEPGARTLPLGRPIPNTETYVLDPLLEPVPTWVAGEVYLGGGSVSRGYLGQPRQTALRFVPDPFAERPGQRLYRTGDLARHRASGVVEFLGRIDHQVKFHGFRVELEEIRAAMLRHERIRDGVVRLLRDDAGRDVLAAYYVSRHEVDAGELRDFLAESLLEETLPSLFVHLRRLPLNLNGKVNVEALPDLAQVREQLAKRYVAPRTPVEEKVAAIWAEVLGAPRVGIADNFFELGGHSLLATRVISRLRHELGAEVPLRSLFEHPTVAELAGLLNGGSPGDAEEPLPEGGDDLMAQLDELEGLSDDEAAALLEQGA